MNRDGNWTKKAVSAAEAVGVIQTIPLESSLLKSMNRCRAHMETR